MIRPSRSVPVLACLACLVGCGGLPPVKQAVDRSVADAQKAIGDGLSKFPVETHASRKASFIEYSDQPYLGSTSIPRPTDELLPASFKQVSLQFPGRHTLHRVASFITLTTGIPVTISADVLSVPSAGAAAGAAPQAPAAGPQPSGQAAQLTIGLINYSHAPLTEVLDGIAAQASCSWQYKDNRITFFRNATRTFSLPYLPLLDSTTTMVVGQTTSASTGTAPTASSANSGNVNSAFSVSMSYNFKPWEDIARALKEGLLSPAGKAIVMPSSGTVTVTDGPRQIDEAERFLTEQNRYYGRQVALRVEVVSLDLSEQAEFGVDWSVVLNVLNKSGNNQKFTFASPTGSTSTSAGSAGIALLKQVNGATDFSGSTALLKALSSVGKVKGQRTWETLSLNRRMTPVASIRTTGYIAQTTPAPATVGGATGGLPGLTPGSVTFGFVLNMMPTITSRNSVVLDFGLNLSDLKGLTPQSSGSGANQQTIELPDTIASQMVPSVTMNTGDTLILSGLIQDNSNYTKRGLDRDLSPGFGGLFKGASERQTLIVLVTPVVAEF